MKPPFLEALADGVLLADGAMGTMLYAKGIFINTCFDELNLRGPGLVAEVHREYIRAGADVIETNTFGANRFKLRTYGLDDRVREINREGARLARAEAGPAVYVAGAVGPLGATVEPWGTTSASEAEEAFAEQAAGLCEGGVDLMICETFGDVRELGCAIRGVRRVFPDLPLVAQMTIGEEGETARGTTPELFVPDLERFGADVLGLNCSVGPAPMLEGIERMARLTVRPLSAMPNAGIPRSIEGRRIYMSSPEYLAEFTKRFIQAGVKLVGGCCGTTPAHLKAMRAAIRALRPPARPRIAASVRVEGRPVLETVPLESKSGLGRKLRDKSFVVSVEIVPPRGFDVQAALAAARLLRGRGVDCVNIPDGPRASARMSAMALAVILARESGLEPLLHYACRDRNLLGMQSDLLGLYAQGIRNLLLITGDPPKLGDYPDATAVFDVDSIGLASMVAAMNRGADVGGKTLDRPTSFLAGVGANPGAVNLDQEIARLAAKAAAGAEFVVTQPVFEVRRLEVFLKRAEPFGLPVIAGLWPLASLRNAEFMDNEVPGASVPPEVMARMRIAQEDGPERARAEGVAIARETLASFKNAVAGVQISPPGGRIQSALDVLEGVLPRV